MACHGHSIRKEIQYVFKVKTVPPHRCNRWVSDGSQRNHRHSNFLIILHLPESLIIVGILGIAGDGLIVSYFAGVFSVSRDSLIKTGSLIAGIGLGWNILIAILQLAGIYFFVLALLGVLVTIAGEVIVFVKLITLFQRDSLIVVFCIFVLLGLLLSLFWIWASIISGAGLGSLLIYFYTHNITY